MRVVFEEVSIKRIKRWTTPEGAKRQQTKKFWQTLSPFNKNPDGSLKTREQIQEQLLKEADQWMKERP